jgi:hypothetical protein
LAPLLAEFAAGFAPHAKALGAPGAFIAAAQGAALIAPIPIAAAALGGTIAKTGARTLRSGAAITAGRRPTLKTALEPAFKTPFGAALDAALGAPLGTAFTTAFTTAFAAAVAAGFGPAFTATFTATFAAAFAAPGTPGGLAPFGLARPPAAFTTGCGAAGSPGAAPAFRTALKTRAHGVLGDGLWIVLLQVI